VNDDFDETVAGIAPRVTPVPTAPDTSPTVVARVATPAVVPAVVGNPRRFSRPQATAPIAPPPPPRPVFYRFRIFDTVVPLDAAAIIGRLPARPRVSEGRAPRLVRVPSPRVEVSSSHIEIRQLGASVVLTDLRSTNGSTVIVPGSAPRKLRQGESMTVSPGTLVDIGDGNVIEILPMQRD
jgi:hypothetical protein